MSVSAATLVSFLPLERAGAVAPEGDAQAFGLAINDAGQRLDQGLGTATPLLGAQGLAPAAGDAPNSGLQVPARVILPAQAQASMLQDSGMPTASSPQETTDPVQTTAQFRKWTTGMRQPAIAPAAPPVTGQGQKVTFQDLAQATAGLLAGAGVQAGSADQQQADQDPQPAAVPNLPAQLQVAQRLTSNRAQAPRSVVPRQDGKPSDDPAATTADAGEALISAGSEPARSSGYHADGLTFAKPAAKEQPATILLETGRSSGRAQKSGQMAGVGAGPDPAPASAGLLALPEASLGQPGRSSGREAPVPAGDAQVEPQAATKTRTAGIGNKALLAATPSTWSPSAADEPTRPATQSRGEALAQEPQGAALPSTDKNASTLPGVRLPVVPRQDGKPSDDPAATTADAGEALNSAGSEFARSTGYRADGLTISKLAAKEQPATILLETGRSSGRAQKSGQMAGVGAGPDPAPASAGLLALPEASLGQPGRSATREAPVPAGDAQVEPQAATKTRTAGIGNKALLAATPSTWSPSAADEPTRPATQGRGEALAQEQQGAALPATDKNASTLLGVRRPQSLPLGSNPALPAKLGHGRVLAEAAHGQSREKDGEKDSKAQIAPADPAQVLAAPAAVLSAPRVAADSPPTVSVGSTAAPDSNAIAADAPASRLDTVAVSGQDQPVDASGFVAPMPDNQAGAVQPGLSRQDMLAAKLGQPGAPVPTAVAVPPAATLQTSKGLGKGLALEMRKSIEDGREHMRVRLDPKDLGQLDVRLSFEKGGALRAVITASTSSSNDLLQQELPTLVRNLADAGVRMDEGSLRFELQSGSGGGSGQRQTFQDDRRAPSRNTPGEDLRIEEDDVLGTRPWRASGQFDFRA